MASAEFPRSSLIAAAGAVLGAAIAACILHRAPDRAAAAAVVPVAWAWGACALFSAWAAREARVPTAALFLAAIAVRVVLVGTPPLLSDDLYRYLWEGLLLNHGGNPFLQAPASVAGLDDVLRAKVNHPQLTSIYPPVALLWFRLLATVGRTPAVAQGAAALADLGTVWAVREVGRARGGPDWPAWLYALLPLPALEAAAGAHVDVVAVALAAIGLALWVRGRSGAGVLVVVLAAGAKLLPALWLPVMATRRWRREALFAAVGVVLVVVLALPVLGAGPHLLSAWDLYTENWTFNGLAYPLLKPLLGAHTRSVLVVAGGVAVAVAWWRLREPVGTWAVAGGAFALLSPTVYSWYLLWPVVPGLMRGRWGWAAASVPLLGSYFVLRTWDAATGTWTVPSWLPWITWGPALLVLLLALLRSRRARAATIE